MDPTTGTRPMAESHAFDTDRLQAWLTEHLRGFEGPLGVEQFKGGQSNPTYLLRGVSGSWVMRTKPGPASRLLPSAHAIDREFRVLRALAGSPVPVARMDVFCEDESVIGRSFYVMEHVEGRVLWDQGLPGMDASVRRAHYDEMNRVISSLHSLDPASLGLGDYGRPGNYFERQITRWTRQYQACVTEPIEAMDRLMDWLPRHIPAAARDDSQLAIVHGDYRLDNLIFDPAAPRVRAVLDWELSTIGHPLADFSYHCMSWHIPHAIGRGIGGLDLAELGIPDEGGYIARYCERTGRRDLDALLHDWPFYIAYNLFRIAAILQGITRRALDGIASSAEAREAGAGARPLADLGWRFAQRLHGPA
jgi:aminoglycoside phosphotransferase (APT) family kinase protein